MKAVVGAITSAAAVEALETNIEASSIVLSPLVVLQDTEADAPYKRIEALRAVFTIDRLGRIRRTKICMIELATRSACEG